MIGKNTRTWLNEGNEFHLIESTANLVHHFISHSNVTNSFVRLVLSTIYQILFHKLKMRKNSALWR